jgi:hypothetical protein
MSCVLNRGNFVMAGAAVPPAGLAGLGGGQGEDSRA